MGMLPGIGKMQKQIAAGIDDLMIKRQEAIILSMTKKERVSVSLLNASRRNASPPDPAPAFKMSISWSNNIKIWRG